MVNAIPCHTGSEARGRERRGGGWERRRDMGRPRQRVLGRASQGSAGGYLRSHRDTLSTLVLAAPGGAACHVRHRQSLPDLGVRRLARNRVHPCAACRPTASAARLRRARVILQSPKLLRNNASAGAGRKWRGVLRVLYAALSVNGRRYSPSGPATASAPCRSAEVGMAAFGPEPHAWRERAAPFFSSGREYGSR